MCRSTEAGFYVVCLSPVGNVEAGQVVSGIAEEVQQGVAGLRHHLRNRLIPVTLRNNQTTATMTDDMSLTFLQILNLN